MSIDACLMRSATAMRSVRLLALDASGAEYAPPMAVRLLCAAIAAFRGVLTCTPASSVHKGIEWAWVAVGMRWITLSYLHLTVWSGICCCGAIGCGERQECQRAARCMHGGGGPLWLHVAHIRGEIPHMLRVKRLE